MADVSLEQSPLNAALAIQNQPLGWLAAAARLQQGMQQPEGAQLQADFHPGWWWGTTPEERASGQAQAIPLGSLADPVSTLASLVAPAMLARWQAFMAEPSVVGMPRNFGQPQGKGVFTMLGNERGSIGGPRMAVPPEDNPLSRFTHWRYGAPPPSGRSWNARDMVEEAGVSAFPIDPENLSPQAIRSALGIQHRPIYLLRGEQVGRGADAEHLLAVHESAPAPAGWEAQMPWGMVRQPGTPREELARMAAQYGVTLPKQATRFEIYDANGELAASWSAEPQGLGVQRFGAYDPRKRGVQALDVPETAARVIARNKNGKEISLPAKDQ